MSKPIDKNVQLQTLQMSFTGTPEMITAFREAIRSASIESVLEVFENEVLAEDHLVTNANGVCRDRWNEWQEACPPELRAQVLH